LEAGAKEVVPCTRISNDSLLLEVPPLRNAQFGRPPSDGLFGAVIAIDFSGPLAPQLTRQCEHNRADEDPDEAQELVSPIVPISTHTKPS
jgi:hypothetical protein